MSIETTAQDGHLHLHTVPELCDALSSVFRVHFNESRQGFCRKGRGRSFHADGPKTDLLVEETRLTLRNLGTAVGGVSVLTRGKKK